MDGHLKFEKAFFRRLKLIRGTSIDLIKEVELQLPLFLGVREVVQELRNLNCQLAIATGSFDVLADPVAAELGIENILSNKFRIVQGIIFSVQNPVVTPEAKAKYHGC